MEENLKYKMYVLVERHLSAIDKGIQAGHAIAEYCNKYTDYEDFKQWVDKDKTIVLLNGGSVNDLEKIHRTLTDNDINVAVFWEEDLAYINTAICFIADERVSKYKDFEDFKQINSLMHGKYIDTVQLYETYENIIGGYKNVIINKMIANKHLAK